MSNDPGWAVLGYTGQRVTHYWLDALVDPRKALALCGREAARSYVQTDAKIVLRRCANCVRKLA